MSNADNIAKCRALFSDGAFRPLKAVRSAESGGYKVEVEVNSPLYPNEYNAIVEYLSSELHSKAVSVTFVIGCTLKEQLLTDPEKCCSLISEAWSQIAPELKPLLNASVIEINKNEADNRSCGTADDNANAYAASGGASEITMHVHPMLVRAVLQSHIADFRAFAVKYWGWNVAIHVVEDESVNVKELVKKNVTRDSGRAPEGSKQALKQKTAVQKPKSVADPADIILGREINRPNIKKMSEIDEQTGNVTILGSIVGIEVSETRDKTRSIIKLNVTDKSNTITVKLFPDQTASARVTKRLDEVNKADDLLLVRGNYRYDNYSRDYVLFANDVNRREAPKLGDTAEGGKRVELHLHTQMSTMDGLTKVSEAISTAAGWGHRAIAITDHGVVHALPEAMKAAKSNNIKVIFGCEGYLLDDSELQTINGDYVAAAATLAESGSRSIIFEISAIKFDDNGTENGTFHIYASPSAAIPKRVQELCGITEETISDAPTQSAAVEAFLRFAGDSRIVSYDSATLAAFANALDNTESELPHRYVDVEKLDRNMHLNIKDYSMEGGAVAHHELARELCPSDKSVRALKNKCAELILELKGEGIDTIPFWDASQSDDAKLPLYHIILLAAQQEGLKNLYKLVSYSHLEFFHKRPRIPRSLLFLHRKGMLLGSACERGEVFRSITGNLPYETQLRTAQWYDYLEIQPIANNAFMLRNGVAENEEQLRSFNRRVIELGDKLNKKVVATGDVHYLNKDDAIFRSILMHAHGFTDTEQQAPLYFRTTDDMLREFSYLGEETAHEVVVENPNAIADMCVQLHPFLDEKSTYSPELPGAREQLESMALGEAHRRYGETLPEVVQKRLDKELKSIIGNGYSSLYMVAQKLVSKSMNDGYLVGSRGSVGSSFVATMLGITEVNALPPHYLCTKCKYCEFVHDAKSRCGMDLPDKICPVCGEKLSKEGYDIPFEVFLGFKGDKTPDIDLNFSGEYQPVAHRFTEEMFGAGHAFRAGTISAVQDKTVYGYVKHYCEDVGMNVSEAEANRLVSGCLGVKRTTGQHPGGIVIVPEDYEVFDFCPVQHPADKTESGSVTTHFDFHALDDRLVKLDILGHDDPTALRMLQDLTGLDPRLIPLDDPDTMAIYRTDEPLKISMEPLGCDVGSIGIPEFGTGFVRGMLMETRPTTMEELVRIAGLSHGTDVWNNNAQLLVQNGTASLMEVICTRDDIMNYLISMGGEPSLSFKTMESVRKGRGLTPEMESAMKAIAVPDWFVDSCKKIQYMFPRAHAAAYVMMSFRVAYYKVHYPLEFYAVYYTVRADTFDIELCGGGYDAVMDNIANIKKKDHPDQKEKDALVILEVVAEMNMRGFELLPIDIYKSKAKTFVIEDGKIRPPFTAIAGLGESVAIGIENGAAGGKYISKEDFINRTKANTAVIDKLEKLGCLKGLSATNQISMF